MRCQSCSKFATYDLSSDPDPELEVASVTIDTPPIDPEQTPEPMLAPSPAQVNITGSVRIVLTSECCGDELKEATFDVDMDITVPKSSDCTCEWNDSLEFEVESTNATITDRMETTATKTLKSGRVVTRQIPMRSARTFYGYEMEVEVKCPCGKSKATENTSDDMGASEMDELS